MSWSIESALPEDVEGYLEAQRLFRERTILKVLKRRDDLIFDYFQAQRKKTADGSEATTPGVQKQQKELKKRSLEAIG